MRMYNLHLYLLLKINTHKRYVEKWVIVWEFAAEEGKGEKSMEKKGLVIIRVGRKKRGKRKLC